MEKRHSPINTLKRLLTVSETAEYLNISEQHIYNSISRKAQNPFPVKPKRIGKAVRFDIQDLENFLATEVD